MYKITAKIDGMMCGMCESHINDAIRKAFPNAKVSTSHTKGQSVIQSETDITEAALRDVITPTGYQLISVTAEEAGEKKGLFAKLFH